MPRAVAVSGSSVWSGVFRMFLVSVEADLLTTDAAFRLCISSWDTVNRTRHGLHSLPVQQIKTNHPGVFSPTFAVVQIHMDGLALAEGAEGHHVLVRVEGHGVQGGAVAELGVDRHLVTWGRKATTSSMLLEPSNCSLAQ